LARTKLNTWDSQKRKVVGGEAAAETEKTVPLWAMNMETRMATTTKTPEAGTMMTTTMMDADRDRATTMIRDKVTTRMIRVTMAIRIIMAKAMTTVTTEMIVEAVRVVAAARRVSESLTVEGTANVNAGIRIGGMMTSVSAEREEVVTGRGETADTLTKAVRGRGAEVVTGRGALTRKVAAEVVTRKVAAEVVTGRGVETGTGRGIGEVAERGTETRQRHLEAPRVRVSLLITTTVSCKQAGRWRLQTSTQNGWLKVSRVSANGGDL